MGIPHNDINKLKFLADENIKLGALNSIYERLIENDNALFPAVEAVPKIWECRWWNDNDSRHYYKKGEAVWINTEVPFDFVKSYEDDIYEYCMGNAVVAAVANEYREYDPGKWREFCEQIVDGSYDPSLPPLYYLGNLTDPLQLRISLVDGNNMIPTKENVEKGYWRDFFIEMTDEEVKEIIISAYATEIDDQLQTHLKTCHLSGMIPIDDDGNLPFLQDDFSNVIYGQHFENHRWYSSTATGFACIKHFQLMPTKDNGREFKWFRVWSNGLLEHGGVVDTSNVECKNKPFMVKLNWNYDDGRPQTAPTYDYPSSALTKFYQRDKNYAIDQTTSSTPIGSTPLATDVRYTISITPIYSSTKTNAYSSTNTQFKYYEHVDTFGYTNSSFQIIPTTNVDCYSYYIRGYSAAYRKF